MPDSRALSPPPGFRSEGTKHRAVACGDAHSVEKDYGMRMAGGCRSEPSVDSTDLGSKVGKERPRPLNRRDNHSLDSAQVLNGDSSSTQRSAGFSA